MVLLTALQNMSKPWNRPVATVESADKKGQSNKRCIGQQMGGTFGDYNRHVHLVFVFIFTFISHCSQYHQWFSASGFQTLVSTLVSVSRNCKTDLNFVLFCYTSLTTDFRVMSISTGPLLFCEKKKKKIHFHCHFMAFP